MSNETGIPVLMDKVAQLMLARGVKSIKDIADCVHIEIDDKWEAFTNGHKEAVTLESGEVVPGYSFYFRYNGWPAGIINAGGGIIAAGEGANEAALTTALESAIKKEVSDG